MIVLSLGAAVGRFDASRYPDDRFLFAGGELLLRVELGPAVRVTGAYRPAPGERVCAIVCGAGTDGISPAAA